MRLHKRQNTGRAEEQQHKAFWNFFKSCKQDNTGVSPLKVRGQLVSDSPGKTRLLLQQFKSVFTQDTYTTLSPVNSSPPPSPVEQIEQIKVTTPGVTKLLRNLNPAKAPGPDNIPNQVLKTCADQIAPALCRIYQKSLDTSDRLEVNISCVFKKGDHHQPENYRPISLTSVPCKILETHHLPPHSPPLKSPTTSLPT